MAYYLAFKRLASSGLNPNSCRCIRPVLVSPSCPRFFNTNTVHDYDDDAVNERSLDVDRRFGGPLRRRDNLFSDVFDPFSATRSLSQVLNMMDQVMESPFFSATSRGGLRRGWDARETDDALNLSVDMPGLDKEDVKLSVEQNTLVIKGAKESEDEEGVRRYSSRIDLPEKIYRTDQIKAEMKNGVLKVAVPKVKEEDRRDMIHVKVE